MRYPENGRYEENDYIAFASASFRQKKNTKSLPRASATAVRYHFQVLWHNPAYHYVENKWRCSFEGLHHFEDNFFCFPSSYITPTPAKEIRNKNLQSPNFNGLLSISPPLQYCMTFHGKSAERICCQRWLRCIVACRWIQDSSQQGHLGIGISSRLTSDVSDELPT